MCWNSFFRISDRKGYLFRFDVNPTIPKVWLKAGFLPSDLNRARFKRLLAVKSVCKPAPKSLFCAPALYRGFRERVMIGLLKRPLPICESDWRENPNRLAVIRLSLGTQNKELGAASQTLLTGSETQAKLNWLRGHSRFNYSDTCWSVLKLFSMTV